MPVGEGDCSLLQNALTGSRAHPASYSLGTGVNSRQSSVWGVTLTARLHVMQMLRMSGAVVVRPLYAFMAWTEKTLPFCLYEIKMKQQ
jgi:hypothetical protein